MNKKTLLAINLNEYNLDFLNKGARKYDCYNIKKFLKLKNIKTFSIDKIQDKNLDPWVQNISINSGQRSSKHKIFNLGQKISNNIDQIWDYLSKKNYKCGVWGPMNTNFKDHKNIKIFLPDPWNYKSNVKPIELNKIYRLSRVYARDYTDFNIFKNLKLFLNFFLYSIKSLALFELLKYFPLYLKIITRNGIKNYFLFFIFDIISLIIFKNISKKFKLNFSLIFLNSLAHFQHNNWDEKENHKDYFLLTDQIFYLIFKLSKGYDSLLIYNSFSQKLVKTRYLIRPKNPLNFFKSKNIQFTKFHSNMTNGFIITFSNKKDFNHGLKKIKNFTICGFKLFEIKLLKKNQFFCRVQIQSKKDISKYDINYNNIKKNLFYNKNADSIKKNDNIDIFEFINTFSFIKTTSKHTHEGSLFYKNLNLKSQKKIENIEIFKLIQKIFYNYEI